MRSLRSKLINSDRRRAAHTFIVLTGIIGATSALAHHAANAFFGGETVLISGTLRGVKIVNPHSYFRITMDDGTDWVFESQRSGTALKRAGFTNDIFVDGRRVVMSGDAATDGKKRARWRTVAFPGENDADELELYILGRSFPDSAANLIRGAGQPCANGIPQCVRLDAAARASLEKEHGSQVVVW
jgi:hypothetical protein